MQKICCENPNVFITVYQQWLTGDIQQKKTENVIITHSSRTVQNISCFVNTLYQGVGRVKSDRVWFDSLMHLAPPANVYRISGSKCMCENGCCLTYFKMMGCHCGQSSTFHILILSKYIQVVVVVCTKLVLIRLKFLVF